MPTLPTLCITRKLDYEIDIIDIEQIIEVSLLVKPFKIYTSHTPNCGISGFIPE